MQDLQNQKEQTASLAF